MDALHLLASQHSEEASRLARELEQRNRHRQNLTREISARALEIALEHAGEDEPLILFAEHADFHSGLVGLAASRLCEQCHRPALVAQRKDGKITGSARSVAGFHIARALLQSGDLLDRHGGHPAAAGFTLDQANWERFVGRLRGIATEQLSETDLRPALLIDTYVHPSELTERLAEQLDYFEPSGHGNPIPLFLWLGAQISDKRAVGKNDAHLKLKVGSEDGVEMDAIGFWLGDKLGHLPNESGLGLCI